MFYNTCMFVYVMAILDHRGDESVRSVSKLLEPKTRCFYDFKGEIYVLSISAMPFDSFISTHLVLA